MTGRRSLAGVMRSVAAIQAVTGLLVLILVGAALVLYQGASGDAADAREDLILTRSLEIEVLNAETGLRGFLLVGREEFLAPYRRAFPAIQRIAEDLAADVEPEDVDQVRRMEAVMAEWRQEFAAPILVALRRGDRDAAMEIVLSGRGKQRTDRFRRLVAQLEARERRRIARSEDRVDAAGIAASVIVVLAAVVIAYTTVVLRRRVRRRVLEPIDHLTATAERIGAGEYGARAPKEGLKEVDVLAGTMNDMAERVEGVVEELRSIDEMKTRFISSVSHELRTPLTSIKGYLEVLLHGMAGELNDEQRDYADVVYRNASRLEALINDLLLLSRLQSGRVALDFSAVDVGRMLKDLARGLEPVAAERRISIRLDLPDEPLVLQADRLRLEQTFANLISNALKYTAAGTDAPVEIVARREHDEVVVAVADRGVGIPADELPRLTERFFRASTAGHVEGTGLGLAITREIVERHGGRLEIESEVGRGSTFRIRLPVRSQASDHSDGDVVGYSSAAGSPPC